MHTWLASSQACCHSAGERDHADREDEGQSIRSFCPAESEMIQFEKLLAIIVGYNGAGKTTIIRSAQLCHDGREAAGDGYGRGLCARPHAEQREVKASVKLLL